MELDDIRKKNIGKRIFKLRREGKNWNEVAEKISDEFEDNFTSIKVKELYDWYITLNEVVLATRDHARKEAFDVNEQWSKEMKEMVEVIKTKAMKHLRMADNLLVKEYDNDQPKAYFKHLPVAIQLFRNILDQVNFLNNRLEKIEINQNNFILNEPQILNIVNKAYKAKEKEEGIAIHPGTQKIVVLDNNAKKKKKYLS